LRISSSLKASFFLTFLASVPRRFMLAEVEIEERSLLGCCWCWSDLSRLELESRLGELGADEDLVRKRLKVDGLLLLEVSCLRMKLAWLAGWCLAEVLDWERAEALRFSMKPTRWLLLFLDELKRLRGLVYSKVDTEHGRVL
jgi:hypothetical protein